MFSTPALMPFTLSSFATRRSRRLRMPAVAVYLICPLRANSTAASTMWAGVGKLGSPTSSRMHPGVTRARLTTSRMPEWAAWAGPEEIAWSGTVAMSFSWVGQPSDRGFPTALPYARLSPN